ncbi:unnamed protein product [Merluccius merluccius]
MDQKHRDILRSNRIHLVMNLKPSELYDRLIEGGIFSQDMIDEIKSSGTRRDQARQLLCDLETRGRRAFPCFIQYLRDTGQQDLAGLLLGGEPASPPPFRPLVQPPVRPLAPLTPAVRPVLQPLPVSPEGEYTRPRRTRKDGIQSYKMDASPCGHCLIINNVKFEPNTDLKNRKGSDIDCDKLEKRFKSLNFIVTVKTNLKYKQIRHHLAELSKKDHSLFDCCVVIILSHGTEVSHNRFPGAVHGVDGPAVPIQFITNYLNGQHCPTLQGKPKLFFIQACGGGETDTGFEVSPDEVTPGVGGAGDEMDAMPISSSSDSLSTSDELDARATLPTPSDILVSYSTFPGFVSWRDPLSGSWYVEILDRILGENAVIDDLVTMLMMVNNEVSQNSAKGLYKQMPGSFNFLRKLFYFQTQSQRQTSA